MRHSWINKTNSVRGALPRRRALLLAATALISLSSPAPVLADDSGECGLPDVGPISVAQLLKPVTATTCDLIGRVVTDPLTGAGTVIPNPGQAITTSVTREDDNGGTLTVEVALDGTLTVTNSSAATAGSTAATAASSPSACSDSAYVGMDQKEYGTYNWYVGDGAQPAAMSASTAKTIFADAIDNITGSTNSCSLSDEVSAKAAFAGNTTYEADVDGTNHCQPRDGVSTWDGGTLPPEIIAVTCSYNVATPGAKNDLVEADVRFNTTSKSFTNSPGSSCSTLYDTRAVGTHEAGHIFGLDELYSGHAELTMYYKVNPCDTKARTLGKGDVLGLRNAY